MKIMKTSIRTIILAAAAVFAAMSCQKEVAEKQELVTEGETIQVSINAGLGDFVAADATKATATPVVRLEWSAGDKVDAYCGTTKISTGDGLTVTPSENGIFAKLSGEISSTGLTSGTSVITFVYSNVNNIAATNEAPTFNFSSQDGTIPFVAYATLVYDGATTLTDKMVEFKFATSVMKIAATNLGGGDITNATISGINTKVTLAPPTSGETVTIEGNTPGTITKTGGIDASTDKTRAIFTVGLVPEDANSSRKLTINDREADLTSNAIAASKSYTTPCAFEGVKDVAYVIIGGKKWATMNLGATNVNEYGKLYSWGNLTGQSGDDGYNPPFTPDNYRGTTSGTPTEGAKINGTDNIWNKMKHDAAYYELGGNWRMPSKGDFIALDIACGGNGNNEDYNTKKIKNLVTGDIESSKVKQGKYWLAANQTTLGIIDELKDIKAAGLLYSDGEHYLFFPAAGYSSETSRELSGTHGYYRSSTWDNETNAFYLTLNSGAVNPQYTGTRHTGFSVRPVSD